jgi:hypothetical protein
MNIFTRLKLIFTYGEGLEELLSAKDDEKREAERLLTVDNLSLCVRHQQESCVGHFADHNCDYCKLEVNLNIAQDAFNKLRCEHHILKTKQGLNNE